VAGGFLGGVSFGGFGVLVGGVGFFVVVLFFEVGLCGLWGGGCCLLWGGLGGGSPLFFLHVIPKSGLQNSNNEEEAYLHAAQVPVVTAVHG